MAKKEEIVDFKVVKPEFSVRDDIAQIKVELEGNSLPEHEKYHLINLLNVIIREKRVNDEDKREATKLLMSHSVSMQTIVHFVPKSSNSCFWKDNWICFADPKIRAQIQNSKEETTGGTS